MFRGTLVTVLCNAGFAVHNLCSALKTGVFVRNITTAQLRHKLDANDGEVVLVDVRSDDERAVSIIPGAISKAEYLANQDIGEDALVVAYCTIGGRSYQFARQQCEGGKSVLNYRQSILGWCRNQMPVVNESGQETNRVHTYWPIFRLPKNYRIVATEKK